MLGQGLGGYDAGDAAAHHNHVFVDDVFFHGAVLLIKVSNGEDMRHAECVWHDPL